MTCNICCEKFNKSLNAKVICPFANCNFEACKTCIRTYLLGTTNDPHCMNCKNLWPVKFLVENLNRSYMDNEYKKHRKQLLVDREISRTPELMNLVERIKLIEHQTIELNELVKKYNEIRKLFYDISSKVSEKRSEIYRIKNGQDTGNERKKFIMPCPGDNCKGYLSTQYKCEVCKLFTCPDCFEIIGYSKEDPHTCLENNIKSAELIKKETKGCPQCGVRIFKISGCDQMWCTECKVAFSWNTGKIVISGAIHNPHYYNYLQQTGGAANNTPRNPGDIVCGGLIPYYTMNSLVRFIARFNSARWCVLLEKNSTIKNFISENIQNNSSSQNKDIISYISTKLPDLHRLANHITNVDLINARDKVRNLINHDDITVQYILNRKTKEELGTAIIKNDNLRKKFSELLNIYEILSVTAIERFNNLYDYYVKSGKKILENKDNSFVKMILICVELFNEYNNLINYCNKQLIIISFTYNQSVNIIDTENYTTKGKKFKQADFLQLEKLEKESASEASCSYH